MLDVGNVNISIRRMTFVSYVDSLFLKINYKDKVKGLQVVFQDTVEDEVILQAHSHGFTN